MASAQCEVGIFVVLKLDSIPAMGRVAGSAVPAVTSSVRVVNAVVTRNAVRWRRGIVLIRVTGDTGHLGVTTDQRELGLRMLEFGLSPTRLVVAIGAGLSECPAMRIVFSVAIGAFRGCFPVRPTRLVTFRAGSSPVSAAKCVVCE